MPDTVTLLPPVPEMDALHDVLLARRSTKDFTESSLSVHEAAGVLWACSGTTTSGHRVCPSARASYPICTTLLAGRIDDLTPRAYRYDPSRHALKAAGPAGDHRQAIADATLDANWLATCPAIILLTADLAAAGHRFPDQPPEHGVRFVWIETGHAAQNAYLWAAAHHLGAALIAGLDDARADSACKTLVPVSHRVLGVIGVGRATT